MEELRQIKDNLDTAESADEVVSLLEQLKDGDHEITLQNLKVSQLGLSVNALKKRFPSNKKVLDLSKSLVSSWKSILTPTAAPEKPSTTTTPAKKDPVVKKEVQKETPQSNGDKKRKSTGNEERPIKKQAHTSAPASEDPRDRVRILLTEAFGAPEEGDKWEPSDMATTIESELFSIFGSTDKDYKAKFRSLSFNITKNVGLRKEILSGSLSVDKLCRMTPQEMASEEEQKKRREIEKWHMEAATIGKMEASTDQFLCGKCKNRKTTYYQLQTRSADEPMTTFVTCTVCGNRWKFC